MNKTQRLSVGSNAVRDSKRPSLSDLISSGEDSDDYSSAPKTKTTLKIPNYKSESISGSNDNVDPDIDLEVNQLIQPSDYCSIPKNAKIIYIKSSGKKIINKYFKSYDSIADSILIGFYTHDKRNYAEKVSNITQLFSSIKAGGGAKPDDLLKNTIPLDMNQIKTLNRDTIVSYQKTDKNWVYNAKFNAFVKNPKDQSTRLSMTTEKGYNFTVNPANIVKFYRHISNNDKTLTFILQHLKQFEQRFVLIEKKVSNIDKRLINIEQRIKK
jgi:hypothetical protein